MKRDYTPRQLEVIDFLEQLLYNRFSLKTLNTKLSDFFGEKVEVTFVDNDLSDHNLMFNLERTDQYGYFDIYMLPLIRTDYEGNTMYITEVAYEFD